MGGIAGDFLRAAVSDNGTEAVIDLATTITHELRIAMFCAGAENLDALSQINLKPSF
jgi:isopentenyl-diphosphate delta-isomerase